MIDWLKAHATLLAIVSTGVGLATMIAGTGVLIRLPADYFNRSASADENRGRHPAPRAIWIVCKNILGIFLAVVGLLMSLPLVPGPGVVLLVVGVSLTSFPGKRRFERAMLGNRFVLQPINALRKRFGRSPISLGEDGNHSVKPKQAISESASRMLGRRASLVRLPGRRGLSPYLVAVLAVCGAIVLKLALRPVARHDEAALGFFAAVMFAAYYGGLLPGLLATALSAIASDFLFLTPLNTFSIWHWADGLRLTQFLIEGGLISIMGGSLRKARERADTERHRVEAANRSKDDFLATVSHELRTPLGAILGWTHFLKTSDGMDPEKHDAVDAIARNARMQSQLIEDLLDISRITGGRMRLALRPMRPEQSLRAAIETVSPAATAKGVKITSEIRPVGLIAGDPDRLQQIVWNLTANAIKFTPNGGSVHVRLSEVDKQVMIQIADTGIGIAPQFLCHLFERFEQADTGVTRRHSGLGLGLAIVRHLVELHGGSVAAHSEGLNQGSTFSVIFPQLEPPESGNPTGINRVRSAEFARTAD